jgi:uncharacterized protein (TIGR01777 family)
MIGSTVCDALLARGDEVTGLSRDPEKARRSNPTVRWHRWQPTMERPPAEAFDEVEGVIHLLGESLDQRWTDEAKQRILESRRAGTHNLVQAIGALERMPKVLVSQSAIGYYGDRGEAIVDESAGPGESFDSEVVQEWEKSAHEVDGTGVRLAVIRTGHVLDPSGGFLEQLLTPFRLGVGGPLAGGNQYVSWVHVDDEVGILLWALDNDKVSGLVNSTAPNPVTNKVFSKALGKALGRPAVLPIPGLALDLMYGSEFGKVLKGGQRVMPRRAQDLGYKFKHPDLDEALRDLL